MSTSEDKYKISWTNKFKKEYKIAIKCGKDIGKLDEIIRCLARDLELPASLCDHELKGNWKHHRELHIEPDWFLIYQKKKTSSSWSLPEPAPTQIYFKNPSLEAKLIRILFVRGGI